MRFGRVLYVSWKQIVWHRQKTFGSDRKGGVNLSERVGEDALRETQMDFAGKTAWK